MVKRCKSCEHLKQYGRSESQRGQWGRKRYFCEHEDYRKYDKNTLGFVGFGLPNDYESPLALKTTPRWCPIKAIAKDDSQDKTES